jgi:hypothetical protein
MTVYYERRGWCQEFRSRTTVFDNWHPRPSFWERGKKNRTVSLRSAERLAAAAVAECILVHIKRKRKEKEAHLSVAYPAFFHMTSPSLQLADRMDFRRSDVGLEDIEVLDYLGHSMQACALTFGSLANGFRSLS